MATPTATIRVARDVHDRLAAQARQRGISLAAMLADLARQAEREGMFAAERQATRDDARRRAVQVEEQDWEATLGDGFD